MLFNTYSLLRRYKTSFFILQSFNKISFNIVLLLLKIYLSVIHSLLNLLIKSI